MELLWNTLMKKQDKILHLELIVLEKSRDNVFVVSNDDYIFSFFFQIMKTVLNLYCAILLNNLLLEAFRNKTNSLSVLPVID